MTTRKANTNGPKYNIEVKLTGTDGNAFALMGKVNRALQAADVPKEVRDKFMDECMAGNYDHLLNTCMEWVHVS
jgi:hypothetical protein